MNITTHERHIPLPGLGEPLESRRDKVLGDIEGMPRIALIAHDAKKKELVDILRGFVPALKECCLVSTLGTGVLVAMSLELLVTLVKSGPMGGDQQIGNLVAEGRLDAVIFLRDPLTAQAHEPDISALLRLCDVHNVPLATNSATALVVLSHVLDPICRRNGVKGPARIRQGLVEAEIA